MTWAKAWMALLVTCAISAALWATDAGLFHGEAAPSQEAGGTVLVERRDFEVALKASGVIKPISQRALGTIVEGIIEALPLEVGDKVRKGDVVARVAARRQEAVVEGLREQLTGERTILAAKQSEYQRLAAYYETRLTLYSSGRVSKFDVDKSKSDLLMAQGSYAQQLALVDKLEAQLSSELYLYEQRNIVAPIDGILLSRQSEVGNVYVPLAGSNTIVTIADLTRVRAELWLSEADIRDVSVGQKARLLLPGETGTGIEASIARIQPEPVNRSGIPMYAAEVELDNASGKLMSGMSVRASVVLSKQERALVLPLSAISTDPQGHRWVLVDGNSGAEQRPVKISLQSRTHAAVFGQVQAGDRVINPYPAAGSTERPVP